ncbi:hypothetical protein [Alistipes senegalensis]|uniref:hypothetical protein n=1 Tax=Alistipes senegalensis TaxID=1288121 RepID=UPI0018AA9D60|nr:hypothetical protein [Alistipes senegalensis]
MKLTKEELATISQWEMNIQTAVRSKYLRNVGRSALGILVPIYERVTETRQYVNPNCAACILEFLQRLGTVYFADKTELAETGHTEAKERRARSHRIKHPAK